jgi:hypothetical protein
MGIVLLYPAHTLPIAILSFRARKGCVCLQSDVDETIHNKEYTSNMLNQPIPQN